MMTTEITRAVRALAYLKTPDRVRAGIRNTYGFNVPLVRIDRILRESEGRPPAKIPEPLPSDAFDYDVRFNRSGIRKVVEPVKPRTKPVFKTREPLPKVVPAPSINPFEGPFQFKVLAASIGRDFKATAADIIGPKRFRRLILPRLVLTKLCIEHGMSCSQIGRKMGGRDHSTILHQRDKFDAYAALYPEVRACYERHVKLRDEALAKRELAA
jgi:hypothetical protein